MARVEATVRQVIADGMVADLGVGCDASIGQVRAAVLARLIRDGGLPGAGDTTTANVKVEIGVLVDAATLAGLDDGPVLVDIGPDTADTSRHDLLDLVATPGVDACFRRLVTDPLTGALVDRGAKTYAASPALRAWLVARDRRCTQPGCRRPARYCDGDHITDYADGGRTTVSNTHLFCRRHHNGKTFGNWQIIDFQPDGSCVYISPHGYREHHYPVRLAPEPPPVRPARAPVDDDTPPF